MTDSEMDPAGSTQQFRAFAAGEEGESAAAPRTALWLVAGIVVLVAAVVALLLLVGF